MNIDEIYVSACRGAFDRNVYDVRLIDWLENVRPQIPLNDYAKKQLPAIMPHGLFGTRRQDSLIRKSGLIQIDVDGKHQEKGWNAEEFVEWLQFNDYKEIAAAGLSCSGSGVYALVAVNVDEDAEHDEVVEVLVEKFELLHGVKCDKPVSTNLSSLRFASPYMPYINLDVKPMDIKL